MKKTLPLLIVCVAAFFGCNKEVSKNIDQSKIWTSYELFYDQNLDKTFVVATFHFSSLQGTILELSEPSEVRFDNEVLPFDSESGSYTKEVSGFLSSGTFEWTDTEGNVYTNSVEIREVAFPADLFDTLFKDVDTIYFSWNGAVLDTNEIVDLTIDGSGESDKRIFSTSGIGNTSLVIDSITLRNVTSGDISIMLDRKYLPALQESTERGGRLLGRFRPIDQSGFLADSVQ